MKLTRVVFGVAYLYLSLAVCVLARSFSEAALDGSPDTAIALEEKHVLAERLRISWSFTGQHRIPIARFRTPHLVSQERRSLRNVHVSPHASPHASGNTSRRGLSTAAIVIIVISTVSLVLSVAVLTFWCCCKKNNDAEWRLLGSFKRRNSEIDVEKSYAQARGDTHLSGY